MNVADAIQDAFDSARRRDLMLVARWQERRPNFAALAPSTVTACTTLTCDRARFWRNRYDDAMDEIDDLRAQMLARGVTPLPRRDANRVGTVVA